MSNYHFKDFMDKLHEKLREFKIPKGLGIIKSYTFSDCESLEKITIPSSVKTIEQDAFEMCTSLEYVTVPKWCEYEEGAFPSKTKVHRI